MILTHMAVRILHRLEVSDFAMNTLILSCLITTPRKFVPLENDLEFCSRTYSSQDLFACKDIITLSRNDLLLIRGCDGIPLVPDSPVLYKPVPSLLYEQKWLVVRMKDIWPSPDDWTGDNLTDCVKTLDRISMAKFTEEAHRNNFLSRLFHRDNRASFSLGGSSEFSHCLENLFNDFTSISNQINTMEDLKKQMDAIAKKQIGTRNGEIKSGIQDLDKKIKVQDNAIRDSLKVMKDNASPYFSKSYLNKIVQILNRRHLKEIDGWKRKMHSRITFHTEEGGVKFTIIENEDYLKRLNSSKGNCSVFINGVDFIKLNPIQKAIFICLFYFKPEHDWNGQMTLVSDYKSHIKETSFNTELLKQMKSLNGSVNSSVSDYEQNFIADISNKIGKEHADNLRKNLESLIKTCQEGRMIKNDGNLLIALNRYRP